MSGIAVLIIMVAMATSMLLRIFLLRAIRSRHPHEFAELGYPSIRRLASLFARDREVQLQFWQSLWSRRFFVLNDKGVSALAAAALFSDSVLLAGVLVLVWFSRM